jgi:tetratricopeptide (TPR) repeat protein
MWGLLPDSRRRALRHAHECASCRAALEAERSETHVWPFPRIGLAYDRIIDRVLCDLAPKIRQASRERADAPALLAELSRHAPGQREMLVRNARKFRSFSLCLLILDRAREVGSSDPRGGEGWALLSLHLTDHLDPRTYGLELIEDVRARSWSLLANNRRIAGDHLGAERAFGRAEEYLRRGTRDHLERAHTLVLKAILRRAQRQFYEAERLLRRALSIWLSSGESQRAVEAMIAWSLVYREHGEPERGIRLLREACELPAALSHPGLSLAIHHSLAACLIDAGKLLEAQGVLLHNRGLYQQVHGSETRLRWIEGELAGEMGKTAEAETILLAVRHDFLAQGIAYDAAIVTLDLALYVLRAGRAAEAKELAQDAFAIFVALGVEREALAAFLLRYTASSLNS